MLLLFKFFICCLKFFCSMEMTSHSKYLGMGASRIVASSIGKNSNMLLLFTFLICCFKFVYSMDMTFHFEHLGDFRIVASSTCKNFILFHIVIFKSQLASNHVRAYINALPLGWYASKLVQLNVLNKF